MARSNNVREYVNKYLPVDQLSKQEGEVNRALAEYTPGKMERKGIEIAVDFHGESFYGKLETTRAVTCSGQAKKGTSHFVWIVTVYVI